MAFISANALPAAANLLLHPSSFSFTSSTARSTQRPSSSPYIVIATPLRRQRRTCCRRRPRNAVTTISATAAGWQGDSGEFSSSSSNGTGSSSGGADGGGVDETASNGNGTDESDPNETAPGDSDGDEDVVGATSNANARVKDPFETAEQVISDGVNRLFDTFYPPLRASCPLLSAEWKSVYGNYILYPPSSSSMSNSNNSTTAVPAVKSVIHFLGGAFFGAVPHHLYNSLLTRLCRRGHIIVATPYDLSFDYLPVADGIARSWERVEADLALEYGPLPVIGLGHSAGAVFHALTSTLFDDAVPKAGNILVSFNCRNASDAIPSYENLVDPLVKLLVTSANQTVPSSVRESILTFADSFLAQQQQSLFTPNTVKEQIIPLVQQGKRFFDQLDPLFNQIAYPSSSTEPSSSSSSSSSKSKPREFYPPPDEIRSAIQNLYQVSETLVVKFTDDTLDDSEELTQVLTECQRQQVKQQQEQTISHSVVELTGSHLTPLAQDPPDMASFMAQMSSNSNSDGSAAFAQNILGTVGGVASEMVSALGAKDLNKLEIVIDEWIAAGISSGKL